MKNGFLAVALSFTCACTGSVSNPKPDDVGRATLAEDSECAPPAGDVSSSSLSLFESETMVAHAADGSIAAVWISDTDAPSRGGVQSIGYRVFRPRCAGWGPVQLINVPGAFYESDPTVTANDRGDFFFAFLAAFGDHTPPNNNPVVGVNDIRVYVAKLPSGASSVEPPVVVSQNPFTPLATDKPWIALTPGGAPVVSYTQITDFQTFAVTLTLARSPDGGRTWTESTVDGSGFASTGQACTPRSRGSRVYVTNFYNGTSGGGGDARAATRRAPTSSDTIVPGVGDLSQPALHLHWSDDDGITFREEDVNRWPVPEDVELLGGIQSCDARGDDVWLTGAFFDEAFTSERLHLGRFTDGGSRFAEDHVLDFPSDTAFFFPAVVAGIHEGLDVITLNFSLFGDGLDGRFLRVHSDDLGGHFGPPQIIADNLSALGFRRHDLGWLGDYAGATPTPNGGLDVTFPRTRSDPTTGENFPQHVSFAELHGTDSD